MTQITKNQHTVPNCYLKSFGDYFFVFNKETKIWEKKHRNNISIIEYWYEHPEYNLNEIENYLRDIETNWSEKGRDNLLEKLNNDNYLLTINDKKISSEFIWTLINRTEYGCETINQHSSQLKNWLLKNNGNELIKDYCLNNSSDAKEINLNLIKNETDNINMYLNEFYWIVLKSSDSMHDFFISDNPIIRIGCHLESNYVIYFILSPTIVIKLVRKYESNKTYEKFRDKIKHIGYLDIIYLNKYQIYNSFKQIYVANKRQQLFVNKTIRRNPNFINNNINRTKITELFEINDDKPSILAFGYDDPKIKR